MKRIYLLTGFVMLSTFMSAQITAVSPAGEYYLRGVMETASGFNINPDGTFQFFFSYGALDRFGEGKWAVEGNRLVLNSRKKPGTDFRLLSSRKTENNSVTIKIVDDNKMVMRYVYCLIKAGQATQQAAADENGIFSFQSQDIDSVTLVFEFCPEKQSVFTFHDKGLNYFEFGFEPWLMEYFFEDFRLEIAGNQLSGNHPLLEGKAFKYEKSE